MDFLHLVLLHEKVNLFLNLKIFVILGYTEIASSLLQSGAFVNTVDRFGNSILANAVRSGNINLVNFLNFEFLYF
jgi:hypothetical protein